ncbi:vascular endothelial growth factor A-like [Solea senegalensis]|uniref:Vascular endothelial growth factor A-like n=1 Tax=Solea senegalensis TaxID=28829 RepID=A0AAV6RXE3_SOLSE|nr:vascular endothelial growth factor A-like [Solea senegalensis]
MKVFKKSICQPMEQLMDVEQELGSIYKPSCVSLRRCSGCCLDEAMECHPTLERNITLQVMKICSVQTEELVELTFVEHQACECRIRHRKRSVVTIVISFTLERMSVLIALCFHSTATASPSRNNLG